MKRILFTACAFLFVLALSGCGERLSEKVIKTHANGQPFVVYYYDKEDQWVASKEFYENGILRMEGSMGNNLRQGEWKSYFPDGKVQSSGFYQDGIRVGKARVYYENGHLWMDGYYADDHKCGEWVFYDEQGYETGRVDYGPCD